MVGLRDQRVETLRQELARSNQNLVYVPEERSSKNYAVYDNVTGERLRGYATLGEIEKWVFGKSHPHLRP